MTQFIYISIECFSLMKIIRQEIVFYWAVLRSCMQKCSAISFNPLTNMKYMFTMTAKYFQDRNCPHTIFQTRLHLMRMWPLSSQSPHLDGHFMVLECWMSQHFGTVESYAQANIQGSPSPWPKGVWWIQSEKDTGNGVGGGCWNWGTDFAHLSHMAKHAQRGQLSLNKHNHFLFAAHKAFKQKPVRRSSPGHFGERTASRQNTAFPVWLSICRLPKKNSNMALLLNFTSHT